MEILTFIFVAVIVGVVVWLVYKYIPIPEAFKTLILIVSIVGLIIYALQLFGLWGGLPSIR